MILAFLVSFSKITYSILALNCPVTQLLDLQAFALLLLSPSLQPLLYIFRNAVRLIPCSLARCRSFHTQEHPIKISFPSVCQSANRLTYPGHFLEAHVAASLSA